MISQRFEIRGVVQGVGFRPFVSRLALSLGIKGSVYNDDQGVIVEASAPSEVLSSFAHLLQTTLPPLARIDSFCISSCSSLHTDSFFIDTSRHSSSPTLMIPSDVAMCEACREELFDPSNRRYGYPFINCTHCGPRYSLIRNLPYDRQLTAMSPFVMCEACQKEYDDPTNRRYHAQPNGCFECGPKLSLYSAKGELLGVGDVAEEIVTRVLKGEIGAIKGVGGFHLVCKADEQEMVLKLRERKYRPKKPFAVMVPTLEMAKKIGKFSVVEEKLLVSVNAPIVIVRKHEGSEKIICEDVAPSTPFIGIFLPYSPLHAIILERVNTPLVMTSANRSGEPVCLTKETVCETLGDVVDFVVDFDREIVNRCDDSVVRVARDRTIFLRVARGYAPLSFPLKGCKDETIMGGGAGQKVTVAYAIGERVVVSPYIADVVSPSSLEAYRETQISFKRLYELYNEVVVCDRHQGYLSTQEGEKKGCEHVGHHHAHIVACMVENGLLDQKVLGVAWDGTGLGDDSEVWGGEFLLTTTSSYERVGTFAPLVLVGGESAIKDPRKVGLSVLCDLFGEEVLKMKIPFLDQFTDGQKRLFYHAHSQKIHCVFTSSIGRLFDGVASLLLLVDEKSYEGESGLLIEGLSLEGEWEPYPLDCVAGVWQWDEMVRCILKEEDVRVACSRFLATLASCVMSMAKMYRLPLVLSGGVFQNATLVGMILDRCEEEKIVCYTHKDLPPNDGCICVGQVAIALQR